jgi:hypothetical protein
LGYTSLFLLGIPLPDQLYPWKYLEEGVDHFGIEFNSRHSLQLREHLLLSPWLLVDAAGYKGIEDVGHGDYSSVKRNSLAALPQCLSIGIDLLRVSRPWIYESRVAGAVPGLVVIALSSVVKEEGFFNITSEMATFPTSWSMAAIFRISL